MNKPYVVVKFNGEEETVAVVPFSCISEDKLSCKWPPKKFSTEKITRLIMGLSKPTSEFNNYPVTVMYAYDKYHSARRACKLAEDNSNLDTAAGETDLEGPRKKRKTKRLYDSEESDESPQVIKKKLSRITNSDSDEDEISNVQKIKETVRTLVQKKKNYPALQHQTSFLPLKHSSKNRIVKLAKQPTNTNVSCSQVSNQNLTYLFRNEVDSAIDSSAIDSSEIDSSVVTKDIALSTDSLSINSSSISDRDEFSNTSVLTQNTLFENDSNDGIILPKAGILKTDCDTSKKTLCAKTLLSQTSIPTMNGQLFIFVYYMNAIFLNCNSFNYHFLKNYNNLDKKCEILLQVLIEQIEEVSGKLDHVNMSLTRVYAKLLPEDPAPIKPKDLPNLPLKNEEAFYAFDNFLKNDDNFLATIDYFVLLMPTGKTKETIPVGKLLAKIFSNSLARIVNYSGSGSVKIKLQDTNILTAIQCAIVKKIPSCNITHVQSKISRWFSTSNQRKMNTVDMI
ncbi:uncharacterized protein [Linepithema humile]|uniref:uncharacterized protein isoform X3 n=1 Tax=Linepithema humile TaxID=83485 RepID=UPI00351DE058